VPLLFGTHIFQVNQDKQKIFNSLVLVSENGLKLDQYDKQKLLMFAEGMPFEFLDEIMNIYGLGTFTKGKEYKVMEINKIKMAINICYEDIIPSFIRKSLNVNGKEANLIVNATNDSWFGKTIEPKMHLQIAGLRSIENRKTLIRSTCTGFSGVFDPTGNLIFISKLYKPDSTVVEVPLMEIKTIYRMGGYLFVYFLGLIILVVFCFAIFRKINFYFKKSRINNEKHHKKMLYQIWTE
jgi:apolipoprotein N-acyltransferase